MAAGRFVIDCDPTRGGQVIVASIGLDQPVKMEIKERYSELIAKAEKGTCYCVCPLRVSRFESVRETLLSRRTGSKFPG